MSVLRQNETQLFFRIVAQLRVAQQERPWSAPDDAERAELLDEIRAIARHTESYRVRRRCLAALKEFGIMPPERIALP